MKVPYSLEQYSPDAWTVCVEAAVPQHLQAVIDLRSILSRGTPILPPSPFQPELMRLVEAGFDYIDIGSHSDWIAAEIPVSKGMSEGAYHGAGGQLLIMKQKIIQLGGGGAKKA